MKNEKIINIDDFISHAGNTASVNYSSIFAVGFNIFTRNILKFIIAGILPFAALIFTSISEYSINKSGVINWMSDEFAFSAFQFTLYIIRFIAFGAAISSWSWLAGEIIFRDTSSPPPLSESINAGWKYAFRTALATLLLWMLITVYAQFVFILCKAAWVIFIPAGYTAAAAAFILVASWTILPALIVIAKLMFSIPLVVFEKMRPMEAVFFSSKLVPWRCVLWLRPALIIIAFMLFLTILMPSWSYINTFINLLNDAHITHSGIMLTQMSFAVLLLIFGSLSISLLTSFFFINSPIYWINSKDKQND